jgi:uncharacterized OsmC-like protein
MTVLPTRVRGHQVVRTIVDHELLTADVTGEVEKEDGVLVIRRIHVAMHLVAPEAARETVERTHGIYAMRCPLYRTLHKTIQLTSSFELRAPAASS